MTRLPSALTAGLACVAVLMLAAPVPALADGPTSWFGGKAAVTGSGTVATQARQVSDFQAIRLSGSFQVKVRQTGREAVEVKADDNLLALVETVVEADGSGRTLHLRWKRGENVRSRNDVVVTVEVARLSAVASVGASDITIDGLKTPSLALSLSGSGDARVNDLSTDALDLSISGSGDVRATGRAAKLKVGVAGSGEVQTTGLMADEVAVSIAGSGDVAVHADRTLDVSIAGSGDVVYAGDAAVKSRVAGSGSISRRK
jgi:hypothetical protein